MNLRFLLFNNNNALSFRAEAQSEAKGQARNLLLKESYSNLTSIEWSYK